jgi:NAD(P)-dependent dehydrogenase (short-subunit alcohol dehydrogenase family)
MRARKIMGLYVVTGGATGIGAAIVGQLRAQQHTVIVVDIKNVDVVADLSTPAGREQAIAGVLAKAPEGLDGVVACAGLGPAVQPFSLIAKVNYFGAQSTVTGLVDAVAKKRGAIVVISSNSAPMPGTNEQYINLLLADKEQEASALIDTLDGHNAYAGSKQAITRWMRKQSTAYAARGVRINAVAPGITKTPLTDKVMSDPVLGDIIKEFGKSVPTGSIGQPDQIANAVCFLLSDKATFVCGSVLFVDGGHDAMLRPDQF